MGPAAVIILALIAAGADRTAKPLDQLAACSAVAADADRLACFDRAAGAILRRGPARIWSCSTRPR